MYFFKKYFTKSNQNFKKIFDFDFKLKFNCSDKKI